MWANAGGIIMEDMLYEGDMALYRTCNRRKNNTRAHRPSIFSGQKGTLDIDNAPGLGTTLASVMASNPTPFVTAFGTPLEELVMPMVSFEGESTTFAPDPTATTQIPLVLKPVGLSANFDNPYRRRSEPPEAATIDALVDEKMKLDPTDPNSDLLTENYGKRYRKVSESFLNHRKLAAIVNRFNNLVNDVDTDGITPLPSLPFLPEKDPDGSNPDFDIDLFNAFNAALGGTGRFFTHDDPPVSYADLGQPEQAGLDIQRVPRTAIDAMGNTVPVIDSGTGLQIIDVFFIDLETGAQIQNPDGTPLNSAGDMDNDPRLTGGPGNNRLVYPQNNRFAELLRAAVTLCIHNPDTKLAMVGSPGLGGWDDHNSAMTSYEARMQTLMSAVRAAVKHIKYAVDDPLAIADRGAGPDNDTSNIVINIFTDFGRNANLNNSQGWDHGNTQNFYTFGGRPLVRLDDTLGEYTPRPSETVFPVKTFDSSAVNQGARTEPVAVRPAGALGKIVGTTNIFGRAGQNRLFTKPSESTDNIYSGPIADFDGVAGIAQQSYEFEPQAIASSIYSWFGVTNPEVLTQNNDSDFATGTITRVGTDGFGNLQVETVDRSAGEPAIDEQVEGLALSSNPLTVKNIAT